MSVLKKKKKYHYKVESSESREVLSTTVEVKLFTSGYFQSDCII
ncbi:unnamed protein product [Larinioides sclopetarius]|uniref:Ribosomal protein L32 n=1 Tax=Larinioides sclopetarius TaxID=280406 RepID=A0AAV1ZJV4_9ARAC